MARDGGQPQGGVTLRDLVAQELGRALQVPLRPQRLAPRPPRREAGGVSAGTPRPQWQCASCGTHNWLERTHCRSCSKAKGSKRAKQEPKPEAEEETKAAERRPLAPEERARQESAKADALEKSAEALRAAGLDEQAAELETAAAAHRKAAKEPPPGKRLDDLEGYAQRCEKRLAAKKAAREQAEQAAQQAKEAEEEAAQELNEAKLKLQALHAELGPQPADAPMGDRAADELLQKKEAEVEQLRASLAKAELERDTARQVGAEERRAAAEREQRAEVRAKQLEADAQNLEALEAELRQLLATHAAAVQAGTDYARDAQRVRALADLAERVEVAKRRRKT
jgi:hypothetical protein